jgi:myo-inositol 2-dehydrogenase / D-chiro-inositol 1-dehydrogenase
MLGFCLIGAGRIGKLHAAVLAQHPKARIVSICDPDLAAADAVAAQTGGAAVSDPEEAMTAPGVQAVLIGSPTDTHVDFVTLAARAGKAVFCEKPIDLDIGRVDACLAVLAQHPVPFTLGFHRRYDPAHRELRDRCRAGAVGRIEHMQIVSRDPAPPPLAYIRRSGGIFRDMMIHDLDQARFQLGREFAWVHAVASSQIDPEIGAAGDFDTATAMFWTDDGVVCTIANSRRAAYGFDQRVAVFGGGGELRVDNVPRSSLSGMSAEGGLAEPLHNHFPERYAQAYRLQIDAFITAVEEGEAPETTAEDGRRALVLANAAEQSARAGQPVEIRF